jgi:hypothetical protein
VYSLRENPIGHNMENRPVQLFESKCKKARFFVDNDMPIGAFHDILMELKGMMVDRMIAVHKDEEKEAEQKKQADTVSEGE